MKIIVGLGNVGDRYAHTRHNIGFLIADELARILQATPWKADKKLKCDIAEAEIAGEKLLLVKPHTMMNLSGECVGAITRFFKCSPEDVWVAYDDIDLPFGDVRFRQGGSSGGHNGLKSIIQHIGAGFHRIRFGIDPNDRASEPSEIYVLRPFTGDQQARLPDIIRQSAQEVLSRQGHINEIN